jgi:hypothetical protein
MPRNHNSKRALRMGTGNPHESGSQDNHWIFFRDVAITGIVKPEISGRVDYPFWQWPKNNKSGSLRLPFLAQNTHFTAHNSAKKLLQKKLVKNG